MPRERTAFDFGSGIQSGTLARTSDDTCSFCDSHRSASIPDSAHRLNPPVLNREPSSGSELLSRIAIQDEPAFVEFYKQFSSSLYGLALRILTDPKDAEDALQEGFTAIWKRASTYDPNRSAAFSWAVMIVRHKAIDKIRTRQRGERLAEKVQHEHLASSEADTTSHEEPAIREERALVRGALARVPAEQRSALELSFFGGFTHNEIADRLQEPLGTVKARIRRGLIQLRELLKEVGV